MSHLTRIATSLNDPEKIENALVWLGFNFQRDTSINSFNGDIKCDFVITNAGHWNVGLRKSLDGKYEVVGDSVSWGSMAQHPKMKAAMAKVKNDDRRNVFAGILAQAVGVTTAMIEAAKLGHNITVSDPDEDGIIRARVVTAS